MIYLFLCCMNEKNDSTKHLSHIQLSLLFPRHSFITKLSTLLRQNSKLSRKLYNLDRGNANIYLFTRTKMFTYKNVFPNYINKKIDKKKTKKLSLIYPNPN